MGIRKYKPTTPGRRGASVSDFVEITRNRPEKSLVRPLRKTGGRNSSRCITARHSLSIPVYCAPCPVKSNAVFMIIHTFLSSLQILWLPHLSLRRKRPTLFYLRN